MTEATPALAPATKPVTYGDVLKHAEVKILAVSRFAAKMAGSTLSYGIMVFLAAAGASQFEISLANSASYLAALLFGLILLVWPYLLTRERVGAALRRALAPEADATVPLGRLLARYEGDQTKAKALVAAYEALRFGPRKPNQRSLRTLMSRIRSLPRGRSQT